MAVLFVLFYFIFCFGQVHNPVLRLSTLSTHHHRQRRSLVHDDTTRTLQEENQGYAVGRGYGEAVAGGTTAATSNTRPTPSLAVASGSGTGYSLGTGYGFSSNTVTGQQASAGGGGGGETLGYSLIYSQNGASGIGYGTSDVGGEGGGTAVFAPAEKGKKDKKSKSGGSKGSDDNDDEDDTESDNLTGGVGDGQSDSTSTAALAGYATIYGDIGVYGGGTGASFGYGFGDSTVPGNNSTSLGGSGNSSSTGTAGGSIQGSEGGYGAFQAVGEGESENESGAFVGGNASAFYTLSGGA
jgi:hypothetical protein